MSVTAMRPRIFAITIIFLAFCFPCFPQENQQVTDLLESLENEDVGQIDFLQVLRDLQDQPINVNTATVRELLKIPFLNEETAREIIGYRREHGKFAGGKDLLEIQNFSRELLDAIEPYIRFQTLHALPTLDYRTQISRALHNIRGFEERRYQNQWHLYQRLRWRPNQGILATALWEKDAGEGNYFDFGSFSLGYRWDAAKSYLQMGDFNIAVGQRLVFSEEYGSPMIVNSTLPFRRTALRWRAKSAVDENAFLRGVLWDYSLSKNTSVLFAASRHHLDATLSDDSTFVRSFYTSGLHRTVNERAKRQRVSESVIVGIVRRQFAKTQVGLQFARFRYSLPIQLDENKFIDNPTYLSGFYSAQKNLLHFQGEAAFLDGKFPAIQQSLLLRIPEPRMMYGALIYYYHPEFWAYHGRAFGKTSQSPGNELGFAATMSVRIFSRTELSAYFLSNRPARSLDEFTFLKRTQQAQLSQKIGKSILYARLTRRVRQGPTRQPARKLALNEQVTHIFRLHLRSEISRKLRLSHRIEFSRTVSTQAVGKGEQPFAPYGVSFYQDLQYRPRRNLSLQLRWTQFDIPDFDERLYEFENDLPGNFRNILLNDRGYKWFFLAIYELTGRWRFSIKFREMLFPDRETLGSGLDLISGNKKRELRMQLQVLY